MPFDKQYSEPAQPSKAGLSHVDIFNNFKGFDWISEVDDSLLG
jgi:hypothetical protein